MGCFDFFFRVFDDFFFLGNVGSMQKLGLFGREVYPERPGVPDCSYYLRNGSCGYGPNCRFNHPSDRDRRSVSCLSCFSWVLCYGNCFFILAWLIWIHVVEKG